MTTQAIERTRIHIGGYKWLRGECVKTNKAFCEIIVTLCRFIYGKSVASHGIATKMCFQILTFGKWKLDYLFIHMYKNGLSCIYI